MSWSYVTPSLWQSVCWWTAGLSGDTRVFSKGKNCLMPYCCAHEHHPRGHCRQVTENLLRVSLAKLPRWHVDSASVGGAPHDHSQLSSMALKEKSQLSTLTSLLAFSKPRIWQSRSTIHKAQIEASLLGQSGGCQMLELLASCPADNYKRCPCCGPHSGQELGVQ